MSRRRRIVIGLLVLAVLGAAGALLPLDERVLSARAVAPLLDRQLEWATAQPGYAALESLPVILLAGSVVLRPETMTDSPHLRAAIDGRLAAFESRHGKAVTWIETPGVPPPLSIVFHAGDDSTRSIAIWRASGAGAARSVLAAPHARRSALLPPLVAIGLALAGGRLLLALGAGAAAGLLLSGISLVSAVFGGADGRGAGGRDLLLAMAMAAAMAGVVARSGGWAALGAALARRARGARSAQLAAALLGGALFLDAVTSALATGLAMRPLADRCRVAREKLAYIADATAAPVAALALAGATGAAFTACFYSWFALVVLAATIVLGRELGPMRDAARRVSGGEGLLRGGALPLVQPLADPAAAVDRAADPRDAAPWLAAPWLAAPWRALNALLPLAVLVLVVVAGGGRTLLLGATAAWVAAVLLALVQALLGLRAIVVASLRGVGGALPALAAFVLAGIVGTTARDLGAADVLLAMLPLAGAGALLAPLLFLVAAAIAFALGSAFGALAIVLPFATAGGALAAAAALQGVAAGTHLSPLAPSALAASAASAADHLDHVRTQLPYGLLAFAAALLLGFVPAALGVPPAFALAAGALVLVAVVRTAGRGGRAC